MATEADKRDRHHSRGYMDEVGSRRDVPCGRTRAREKTSERGRGRVERRNERLQRLVLSREGMQCFRGARRCRWCEWCEQARCSAKAVSSRRLGLGLAVVEVRSQGRPGSAPRWNWNTQRPIAGIGSSPGAGLGRAWYLLPVCALETAERMGDGRVTSDALQRIDYTCPAWPRRTCKPAARHATSMPAAAPPVAGPRAKWK